MAKHSRTAFTLIEVMVAVMIVSVVIAALLEMRGALAHKYLSLKEMAQINQYNTFLIGHDSKYGFDKSNTNMKTLVDDFELESDLRRKLSALKITLDYEELNTIDTSEFQEKSEEEDSESLESSGLIFEIGKSILSGEDFSSSMIRVRIQ